MKLRENVDLIAIVLLALLFGAGAVPILQERAARFAGERAGDGMRVMSVAAAAPHEPFCWR